MIGFLGGTGPEGRDLALRLALAGEDVIIGSRDGSRGPRRWPRRWLDSRPARSSRAP